MTTNKLLNISFFSCRAAQVISIISIIILTIVLIHFQLDREYYKGLDITFDRSNFQYVKIDSWNSSRKAQHIDTHFIIDTISIPSLYFIYVKYVSVFVIIFLALNQFKKIISSITSYSTFKLANVNAFRKIGQLLMLYLVLSSFDWIVLENGSIISFNLSITPLALMGFSFILAEIFKEGYLLKQENDLTI